MGQWQYCIFDIKPCGTGCSILDNDTCYGFRKQKLKLTLQSLLKTRCIPPCPCILQLLLSFEMPKNSGTHFL